MKGELSAFAEQVFLCFFIFRLFVNRRILNGLVMLCVAVHGIIRHRSRRSLLNVSLSRIAVVACFSPPVFTCVSQERVLKWLLEASSMIVHAHF
jgi:hypothetical protein